MANISNFNDTWEGHTHGEVEDVIKSKVAEMEAETGKKYEKPDGGIPLEDLSESVQDAIEDAASQGGIQQESDPTVPIHVKNITQEQIASWNNKVNPDGNKVLSDNNYTTEEKTKLAGIEAGAQVNVAPDAEMSGTSEKAVQNKVIKAYVDQAVQTVQNALNALMSGQSVTDAIDTFNEIVTFLNGIDTDDPTLFNQLKSLSDAITALNTTIALKANSADLAMIATSGSYNDLTDKPTIPTVPTMDATPTAGNTTHTVSSDGVAAALNSLLQNLRIVNGEWYIGNTATGVSAQGPQGSCAITGDGSNIIALLVNNLVTGGAGNILTAEMGKVLKGKIDEVQANIVNLYNKMANMAFWDAEDKAAAEPTELDWSIPKVAVTITNSIGSGAVIKRNGQVVSSTVQVDQGDALTLTIEAASGMELSNVAATVDGVAATLTESSGVYTLAIDHVNATMAIVISGSADAAWNIADKSKMVLGRSINPTTGQSVGGFITGTTPEIIQSPIGPDDLNTSDTNNVSTKATASPAGTSAEHFNDIGSGKTTLYVKFADPNAGGLTDRTWASAVAFYDSSFTFISRSSYDYGTDANDYELQFSIPTNARFAKIICGRKNGSTTEAANTYFSGLAADFLKYRSE